jgi:hypothetical protein
MNLPNFLLTPLVDTNTIKLCRNCVHHEPVKSKCTRFGRLNLVTGQVHYMDALMCREYDNFCANEGKFFTQDKNETSK